MPARSLLTGASNACPIVDPGVVGAPQLVLMFTLWKLEQKSLALVRMLNFGAKNAPPVSYPNDPISFLSS
jgi:hypothetical protein